MRSNSTAAAGRDLTVGSIPRHMITFSLPMLAGSFLQTAYAFVNAIWVGQFLGKRALAAVTVSFPVVFVMVALGAGLTIATNILVSQHYGAKDMKRLRLVVDSSYLIIGGLSVVLLAVGALLAPHILIAMDTPPDVLPLAVSYMRVFLLSLPMGFGLFVVRSMLQGIGDSRTPLWFLSVSVIMTAALDPLLMFGWLGFPKLGLNGTAWAANLAQAAALVALLFYLQRTRNPVAPAWRHTRFDMPTALTTFRIGIPSAVQQGAISIGMVFVTGIVNGFGEDATAAFGAAGRVDQIAFLPAMTFSLAISTLAGQNIGAGRMERVREIFRWGCIFSGAITLAISALALSVPELLLRIFTTDAAVVRLGADYLHIVGAGYILFAIMFVSNGIINGSGHTLVTTLFTLISLWVVRVPFAILVSRKMGSVNGVWYSMSLSFFVAMICSLAYYYSGRWRRRVGRPETADVPERHFGEEVSEI